MIMKSENDVICVDVCAVFYNRPAVLIMYIVRIRSKFRIIPHVMC